MSESPVLRTSRLILRELKLTDAPIMQALLQEHDIAKGLLNLPHPCPDGFALETLQKAILADNLHSWAITRPDEDQLMGRISLRMNPVHASGSIAYWLGKVFWNQGYLTEAGRAVMSFGFRVLKVNRIEAEVFSHNIGSMRVMEKIGLRREGLLRERYRDVDGVFQDVYTYGVIAREWS